MEGNNTIFAVIDTNVLVSSFFSKDGLSSPAIVIDSIFRGRIIPLYNEEILQEYQMSVEDSYLVTGNLKHFPKDFHIVSPRQMVEILEDRGFI